jgi:glycolate oxidase FAD binding subunit
VSESLVIDGSAPLPVRRPASVREVGELVTDCRRAGHGVYPVGGRTLLDLGRPPAKPGIALDATALDRVIDYPARDMTVTVEAGMTVAGLGRVLAAEGQWLPIDVPHPERATLGGAVATNASGPRRFGHGTLRDYVIGISFVSDDGVEVKGGGRVVKNVAGYDLMKLHTGALGTLGVVTQVTLKVKPRPEASAAVTFTVGPDELGPTLDRLHGSASRPVAVEVTNHLRPGAWAVAVGFEEKASTVRWQADTLLAELKATPARDVTELTGADADALWRTLTDLQVRPESRYIWKAGVLPSKIATVGLSLFDSYLLHAEALNGIIWVHAPGDDPGKFSWIEQQVTMARGRYTVRRCPVEWKDGARMLGRPLDDFNLMRHVKRTLDPDDVFNPGRLFEMK